MNTWCFGNVMMRESVECRWFTHLKMSERARGAAFQSSSMMESVIVGVRVSVC